MTTYPDLQVDNDGEIILSDGDLAQVTADEAIAQGIRIAIRAIKGEWFLNTQFGLDHDLIFRRNYSMSQIRREFRRVVMAVPGVVAMGQFQAGFDSDTPRQLNVSFLVLTENSVQLTIEETING
jgi:hypothetical protein